MKRCVLIGLGGIGAPCAMALARSAFQGALRVVDDDVVDVLNLHRQILFEPADLGQPKVAIAARLERSGLTIETRAARALPETVMDWIAGADVIVDGSDNYATKFLLADAARLAGIPLVTGAALEWRGTVFVSPLSGACYRCLFEDLPREGGPACADVGVMGPIVGLIGVLSADAALRVLGGLRESEVITLDAQGRARRHAVARRTSCALCGVAPRIVRVERASYTQGGA